jgi:hypothetical protein
MTGLRRLLIGLFGLAVSASVAGAYSHFVHYTNRVAPFTPAPEKFDLNTLQNKTVNFVLWDTTAGLISRPDQFPSVLSLIREATRVWNGVETSDLRVGFGGLASPNTQENTPGVEILFEEMDPFTLGLTSTNAPNTFSFGPNGAFVPMRRPEVGLKPAKQIVNDITDQIFYDQGHLPHGTKIAGKSDPKAEIWRQIMLAAHQSKPPRTLPDGSGVAPAATRDEIPVARKGPDDDAIARLAKANETAKTIAGK